VVRRRAMERASRACAVVAMRAGCRGSRRSARIVDAGMAGARANLSSGMGGPRRVRADFFRHFLVMVDYNLTVLAMAGSTVLSRMVTPLNYR
jgi:hypothetical protein